MSFGISLNNIEEIKKFELMQTGDTGHGKTTRALTAVRFGPMFIFDFDGKIQGATRNMKEDDKKKVFINSYKDKTFEQAYEDLKGIKALFDKGEKPFATIVIDTFTILNEKAFIKAMGKKLDVKGSKASFDEWGVIGVDLLNFFNILYSLPCNIIVNCHVAKTEDATGKAVLGVEGQGSFKNKIAKRMTDSHYLLFQNGKYVVRARNSDSVPANSCLPDSMIDQNGLLKVNDLSIFDNYAYKI